MRVFNPTKKRTTGALWLRSFFPFILIAAGTVLPFLAAVGYGLINLDDYIYLGDFPVLWEGSFFETIKFAFGEPHEAIWMPLTWLSYAFDFRLWGEWWGGFHLQSIVVHAINAGLVWILLREILAIPDRGNAMPGSGNGISPIAARSGVRALPRQLQGDAKNAPCLAQSEVRDVPWMRVSAIALALALLAMIWAVHPLRCESVVFVASRKDVLSLTGLLLALIAWVRGSRGTVVGDRCLVAGDRCLVVGDGGAVAGVWSEVGWTALSLVFFALGAMAKPSVMTFPLLALLIDVFAFGRVRFWRYPLPFAAAIVLGWSAAVFQNTGGATALTQDETLLMRLQVAVAAFGVYLRNFVWPLDLAVQCTRRWPELPRFLVPGAVILVGYAGFCLWRFAGHLRKWLKSAKLGYCFDLPVSLELGGGASCDFLLLGLGWFAVAVAPMLGIAGFGFHAFADRFTYIPAIGLSIALGGLVVKAVRRRPLLVNGALLAVVLALGVMTVRQTGFWRDDFTLFRHTLEVDGERNAFAHNELGKWYFNGPHDLEKCVEEFEAAWRIDPKMVLTSFDYYAFALCELGRTEGLEKLIDDYWEMVLDRYDPHRQAGTSIFVLEPETVTLLGVRLTAQVALGIEDPSNRELAELAKERLDEVRAKGSRADPLWLYLLMRQAVKAGRTEEAAEIREWIRTRQGRRKYVQFRYLWES